MLRFKPLDFEELTVKTDLREYHDLAQNRMQSQDMVTEAGMMSLLLHRVARLWIARDEGKPVGYCSILIQSPDHPERSVHLLNSFVLEGKEGQGYGSAMVGFRVEKFGHLPMVVAIRPDNISMCRIARKFGFRPGFERECWRVWHRPGAPLGAGLHRVIVQVDEPDDDVVMDLLASLRTVEHEVTVQRRSNEIGRDPVTLARWPDPAAFDGHITIDVLRGPAAD